MKLVDWIALFEEFIARTPLFLVASPTNVSRSELLSRTNLRMFLREVVESRPPNARVIDTVECPGIIVSGSGLSQRVRSMSFDESRTSLNFRIVETKRHADIKHRVSLYFVRSCTYYRTSGYRCCNTQVLLSTACQLSEAKWWRRSGCGPRRKIVQRTRGICRIPRANQVRESTL